MSQQCANIINFEQCMPKRSQRAMIWESSEDKIIRLEAESTYLKEELRREQKLRFNAERELGILRAEINKPHKRRTKQEMADIVPTEYSEFKSDGKRKARPAETIRSYDDFVAIQNYFLERGKIRDWMLWTIGVALGLRISDLFSFKISSLLNSDFTFRKRLLVNEQKTGKLNDCLITEAVIDAVSKYLDSINWQVKLDDYLFPSKKTKQKMYEEYGWKIISDAGKALDLPFVVGSHTMRKSFANIAVCVDKSTIDMNAIVKVQGLLNHSDQKCTMKYLGTFHDMYDRARNAVSDFILGKTDVNQLVIGTAITLNDIMSKLDYVETMLDENNGGTIQNG